MRRLRTALVWLLLLAVPLQGFAASAMLFCGMAHGDAALQLTHGHASLNGGDGHAHAGDLHDHGVLQDVDGPVGADSAASDLHGGSCSVCASCCSGAALLLSSVNVVSPFAHDAPVLASSRAEPGQNSPGPDRPPRILLA
jgi:hypothetical protein